jgi:DNA-binding response OmpR family regulator
MVVDDNEDMRRHISRLLEDGYRIVTAADGLLAEEALNKQLPDLIVTDLMMPNRNGMEFVESIKKNSEFVNIPVVMLTARAGLDDRIQGLMAAVDDYLVKPFNGRELKVRIHNLLNKQAQFNAFYQQQGSEPQKEPINQSETYIDKVKAVVNQRLMDPDFGVDELAKALHVSEATLRRRLSDNANYTPAAFIRHCRLEKARQLSLQGNIRSMSELANAVGFSKPSYFARLYQKTFNSEVDINRNSEPN